mmetsp:Transcript_34294/g.53495  ORF Transcript_34294/g.53495 Transcript_34294/m.53495 type:complete len:120 (+) Transcript_34294:330-689(+)
MSGSQECRRTRSPWRQSLNRHFWARHALLVCIPESLNLLPEGWRTGEKCQKGGPAGGLLGLGVRDVEECEVRIEASRISLYSGLGVQDFGFTTEGSESGIYCCLKHKLLKVCLTLRADF